jgi:hypothetical protein
LLQVEKRRATAQQTLGVRKQHDTLADERVDEVTMADTIER